MVNLFKLASEQLSKQDHYDFGMRAVKSILVMAGALKRREADLPEDVLLIRAMRDANVPKFLAEDVLLFMALIRDLFPGWSLGVYPDLVRFWSFHSLRVHTYLNYHAPFSSYIMHN